MRARFKAVASRGGSAPAPVGNLVTYTSPADFQTKWAAAVTGDVLAPHATFAAGAPMLINMRAFAAPGVTLIGHPTQVAVVRGNSLANCRVEFVGWNFSADAYQGNAGPSVAYEYSSVDLNDCSLISFQGNTFGQAEWGIMCRGGSGCADITIRNNVFAFHRSDCIRILNGGATNRSIIVNNYFADSCHQERYWAKADGTTPIISSADPGGGYTKVVEPDHPDIIQAYGVATGVLNDLLIQYNTIKAVGAQAIYLDADNTQTACAILDNYVRVGQAHALRFAKADACEMSRNDVDMLADHDPLISVPAITFNRPGGVGNAKGGLNTWPGGTSISNDTGLTLTAAIAGTATAPTPPSFLQTTSNVGNLAVLRARPSYTDYSAAAVMLKNPYIWVDGSAAPYATGARLKLVWEVIKGWLYTLPANTWHRWKKDGSVVGGSAGVGLAYAVSPVTTAGSWVGEWSSDSTDGTNGTWYSSAAVVVATAGTTLDPSRKSAQVTLSNGNLTSTQTGTDNTHAIAKSIGTIPAANGNYYFEVDVAPISGSQTGMAVISDGFSVNGDPHDFVASCFAIFGNGAMFGSGGFTGNLGNMGGAGKAYVSGGKFGIYLRRVGAVDKVFVIYPDNTWSSATGDPTGVGAGIDCSAATSGVVLNGPAYTQKTGDVVIATYSSFAHAAQIGTVIPVQ